MTSAKILIVQNDTTGATPLAERLRGLGYAACTTVSCGRRAIEEAAAGRPDLALVDLGLAGKPGGIEVAEQLGGQFDVPVIWLTDDAEEDPFQQAAAAPPYGFLLKTIDAPQLRLSIKAALALHARETKRAGRVREMQQTIDELRSKARIMDTILNSTREGVVAADRVGRVLFANSRAERIVGVVEDLKPGELYDPSERQRKYGLFNPDGETYLPTDQSPLVRALRGKATDDKEIFIRNQHRPEGVHVNVVGRTLWDAGGEDIEGGIIFLRDINREKEAEASLQRTVSELRDQSQLMETVFESMDEAIFVATTDYRRIWANSRMEEMLGMGVVEEKPEDWGRLYGVYLLDQETMVSSDQLVVVRALRGEVVDDAEFFIRNAKRPEGIHIRASGRPLLDEQGEVQAGVVVFRDVTAQRRAQAQLERTICELRDQSQLMETVFGSMNAGVVVLDSEHRLLLSNSKSVEIMGAGLGAKRTDEWSKMHGAFHLDRQTLIAGDQLPIMRALRGESTHNMEVFVRNEDNPEGIYISVSGRPLRDDDGRVRAGVVVLHDITELKSSESRLEQTVRELRTQTRLMQTVFDNMEEGVVIANLEGNYLLANRRREEIIGKKLIASEPSDWPAAFGAFYLDKETQFPTPELPIVRAMRGEATEDVELFIRNDNRPEGAYVRARGRPLLENGEVVAGVAIFSDITKYKRTEAELERTISDLQRQAQLVDTVFESITDGVVAASPDGRFSIFNSSAEKIVGMGRMVLPPEQWTHRYGIFQEDQKTPVPTDELPLVRAFRGEATDDLEMFIRNDKRPAGVFISVNGRPLQSNIEGHAGGVITFRDVTTRKLAEAELEKAIQNLRDQSELMEAAFNSISDGLVVVDTEGSVLNVNPAGQQIAGFEAMDASQTQLVRKWARYYYLDRETLIPPQDLPINRAVFHGESTSEMNLFVRTQLRPDGFFVRTSVRPLLHPRGGIRGAVAIFRDVTDQVRAEEALVQAFAQGRMEMIDTILHNIGNAIHSVTTGVDTLQRRLADDPFLPRLHALADAVKAHQGNWADYIEHDPQGRKVMPFIIALAEDLARQHDSMARTVARIKDRGDHIADIVRTQKALDSPHMERKDVNLRDALWGAVRVLQDALSEKGIQVEVHCSGAPREIRIQESRFHQMLVNLIKNAMEAIDELAESDGFEEAPRITVRAYSEGDFLHLNVMDNGIGIDTKNTRILFTAGYTTKKSGTGLGLHSVANFVIGSGGQIHALSDGMGQGATLRIMLRLSPLPPPRKDPVTGPAPERLSRTD